MALLPLAILSLAASAQANPLWGLYRRQEADFCSNPDVTTSASLVLTGTGDALYTYTPSRVSDTAQWSIQTPVTITDVYTTSTVYPFGYVWALSGTPGTVEVPALPTTDVPYPLPDGASATLCNNVAANSTAVVSQPVSVTTYTPTSVETVNPPSTPTTPTIGTDNPTEDPSIPLGVPTTPSIGTDNPTQTSSIPAGISTTFVSQGDTTPGSETVTPPSGDTTSSVLWGDETTTAPGITTGTGGSTVTPPSTPGNSTVTEPTGDETTTEGTPTIGTDTTATEVTETETNNTPTNTPVSTTEPTETETATTGTEASNTPTNTPTTATELTETETTGSLTTGTDVTGTDTTGTEPSNTDSTVTDQSTTGDVTTTGSSAEGTTTTEDSNGDTTSEQPDPSATSFPTYDPPTATVTGAAATSEAIEIGPLIWSLWNNRDMIEDDDEDKKNKYIEEVEETKDDIVTLWTNFDVKPEIPEDCDKTALTKRSLISGITDLLDTAAKLIGCAEKVVTNLVDQVKLPDPPIDIIETLTDTLKDISEELEKEYEKPTETENISTTEEPTSTQSCTATGVESCSQTVYLSTSFYKDGDTDTSTVETITTEACTTITACDAEATTDVTTVTSVTSETGGITCDYDCTACVGSSEKRAAPTSRPLERSIEERSLDDVGLTYGSSDGDKSNYIMDMINDWDGDKDQVDWVFANFDLVSGHGEFGDVDTKRWVVGLVGCTGIAIVSKTGWWLAHFMEPGFISANEYDIRRWDERIIGSMDNGNAKYTKPDTLTGDDGVLNLDNDPVIYLSTPVNSDGDRLYDDKVQIIMDKLTGDDAPFNGVEVKELKYNKPSDEVQQGLWQNSAHGKIMIEYTPNQIDLDDNFEDVTPDPREKMIRVWQEFTAWERRLPIYGEPQCDAPDESANGADPSNVKSLAQLFCEGKDIDFSADAELTLGGGDLDPTEDLAADFKFTFTKRDDGDCELSCTDIYDDLIGSCEFNSHLFTGEAHVTYQCGKYALEAIPIEDDSGGDESGGTTQPEVRDNCADPTVYTKFTLDQATEAIDDFCGHDISLPDAAQPVKKTYQYDDVVLQLWTQWSSKGQDGCNSPDTLDKSLSHDACKERFLGAVNDCNTDTTTDKYGNYPYIWNSPNGCIDFWIYGNGDDFSCDDILGVVPIPCQDVGTTLD